MEEVFQEINDHNSALWLGPSLSDHMLQQQKDYIQSPFALKEAVKVSLFIIGPPNLALNW